MSGLLATAFARASMRLLSRVAARKMRDLKYYRKGYDARKAELEAKKKKS